MAGVRRALLVLAAAQLLVGCGGSAASTSTPRFAKQPPRTFRGLLVPAVAAPPIALHDADGRPVTLASQRGRYTLVTFIYTHCPDVCPLIASNLDQALRLVDARWHRVGVLAVSLDPRGDTPAAVRAYVKRMHLVPAFRYLIGTARDLRRVWTAYHVTAVAQGGGLVGHATNTVLVDARGRERLVYDSQLKADAVVHDLRVLMHSTA